MKFEKIEGKIYDNKRKQNELSSLQKLVQTLQRTVEELKSDKTWEVTERDLRIMNLCCEMESLQKTITELKN